MCSRWRVGCSAGSLLLAGVLGILPAFAATRPHYGGVLRVEIREAIETPDPPQTGPGLADLSAAFDITRWEAGTQATFAAEEAAAGGRPFLDGVEVRMGRPLHDQSIALELGRADIVELGLADLRRQPAGRKIWTSSPVRVVALVFARRHDDTRVREALALAVDRAAILNVLLQRQGEISGALLPQWISGYAFVFPASQDLPRARSLAAGSRPLTLGVDDPALRPIADRIALNARDAGLTVMVAPQNPGADVRLAEARVASQDPARALAGLSAAFGLPLPTPDAGSVYDAEHALLEDHRVIPLFHLPVMYGVSRRVKGGPGITPLGEWRFENLWLESARP